MPRPVHFELPADNPARAQKFYEQAFGWAFTDYGPAYSAFDEGLDGGFNGDAADQSRMPLVILWADDLAAMEAKVRAAGGEIIRAPYAFPGGRRFHFRDPSGNELAVWSEE